MQAVTHFSSRIPVNSRPQIVRLHDSVSAHCEFSCVMPFWSLHFFHFEIRIDIEDEEHRLRPGMALLSPPGVRTHTYSTAGHTMYFAHFFLPETRDTVYVPAPLVLDMGGDYPRLNAVFADAAHSMRHNRDKAEIALWYLLQALFVPTEEGPEPGLPEKLTRALHHIADNLVGLGGAEELAQRVGVTARHLNRLFTRQFGMTTAEFIREKRLLEARRYLQTSDYMIKEIGPLVGIPGAQHFNNMIRKRFGKPPQALRESFRRGEE